MQLTCVEEEGTAIWAENIQKKIFIWKIPFQTEKHKHNIRQKTGVEYVDWIYLAQDVFQ